MPAEPETDTGVSRWTTTRAELIEALLAIAPDIRDYTGPEMADAILSRLSVAPSGPVFPVTSGLLRSQVTAAITEWDGRDDRTLADAMVTAVTPVLEVVQAEWLASRQDTPAGTDEDARAEMEALAASTAPAGTAPDVVLRSLPARWRAEAAATESDAGSARLRQCADALAYVLLAIDGDTAATGLLAENVAAGAKAGPPLPPGEYARVEILGHDYHTGWVTESTRAGQPVMVVRDWDGLVIAEVPGHSLYRFVPLATPLKRPEPQRAIAAGQMVTQGPGDPWSGEDDGDDDDDPRPF